MSVRGQSEGERGAVAVLFAVLVLTMAGIGALMVDVGLSYVEGRQLQSGAENGALAVARTCALNSTCDTSAAAPLANANANDAAADVYTICGTATGLVGCGSSRPQRPRFDCPPASGAGQYVEVRTSTRQADGSTVLPGTLSRLLPGPPPGTLVQTCARAAYGAPTGLATELPLTISYCDWRKLTQSAGHLSQPPPYPPYPPSSGWFDPVTNPTSEHVRVWSKTNTDKAGSCTGPAGQALPGGFGWVDTTRDADTSSSGCRATTNADGTVGSDPGASVPNNCPSLSSLLGKVISVPVYGEATGTGNTGTFKITGYAAFYLTGFSFTGQDRGWVAPLTDRPCEANEGLCISGYFTADLDEAPGGTIGGPSMGVTIIRVTG